MTAISIDLQHWFQPHNDWDVGKKDEEFDWAKAFGGGGKGDNEPNPFEVVVGFMAALGAALNGDQQHDAALNGDQQRDAVLNGDQQHEKPRSEKAKDAEKSTSPWLNMVHNDLQKLESETSTSGFDFDSRSEARQECESSLKCSSNAHRGLEAFSTDSSPSRLLLNKMLGMGTLSFSMHNLPIDSDSPRSSEGKSPLHKRRRTVSFSDLPEIHHVESFKDVPGLWDPLYLSPPPVSQTV